MSKHLLLVAGAAFSALAMGLGAHAQTAAAGSAQKQNKQKQKKMCVADIANASMTGIKVPDVKDRWVEELKKLDLNPEWASTATVVAQSLAISGNNRDSIKLRKCDYLILAEVDNPNLKPGQGKDAKLDLVFNFALFNAKRETLVTQGSVPVPSPEKATDAVMAVLPEAAAKVAEAMHPKK